MADGRSLSAARRGDDNGPQELRGKDILPGHTTQTKL